MPKIIGSCLSDHRQRVRAQLFCALRRLLAQYSFESLTMSQIAAQAKVGRTAVYNHFCDKNDLLIAFIAFETQRYTKELLARLDKIADPLDKIRLYVRSQLELKTQYQLFSAIKVPDQHPYMTDAFQKHAKSVTCILEKTLLSAIEKELIPKQNLEATIPLVHAALGGLRLPTSPAHREHLIRSAQNFILRALGVHIPADASEHPLKDTDYQLRPGSGVCPVDHSNF